MFQLGFTEFETLRQFILECGGLTGFFLHLFADHAHEALRHFLIALCLRWDFPAQFFVCVHLAGAGCLLN